MFILKLEEVTFQNVLKSFQSTSSSTAKFLSLFCKIMPKRLGLCTEGKRNDGSDQNRKRYLV